MKKIFYLLTTILLAITLSSYTSSEVTSKVSKKDSVINVKVDVKTPTYQKGDEPTYKRYSNALEAITKAADSYTQVNESKMLLMEELIELDKSKVEELCQDVGISPDELFKLAREDTALKFITTLLIIILLGSGLYFLITLSNKRNFAWQTGIIIMVTYTLGIYLLQYHIYNFLSYVFNHQYLEIKEIITLIK